jgi:hypothetical protein
MRRGYVTLKGSRHPHPEKHRKLGPTDASEEITVTVLLRRRRGSKPKTVYRGGRYRSHDGPIGVPRKLVAVIEAVVGLTTRKVPAQHFATRPKGSEDPPDTTPVTPQGIAQLYGFPPGDGAGQTIGLHEMEAGQPDGETGLEITVAGAIAQGARIARRSTAPSPAGR